MSELSTSKSLLQNAKADPASEAWFQLHSIYEPLIVGWAARAGIEQSDIGDVSQEVLQALASDLPKFEHNGRAGAFRNWLKVITVNRCRRYWEKKKRRLPIAKWDDLDSEMAILDQISDPTSELSVQWDKEHDQFVMQKALELVRHEFDESTYQIFLRYGLQGEEAKSLAEEFDVSVGQVYKSKFRVLDRIKREVHDLISFPDEPAKETDRP